MNNTRANAYTSDCFIRIHIKCMTKHTESLCYVHSRYLIQCCFGFFFVFEADLNTLWFAFNHTFSHKRSEFRFICAQTSMFIIYFVTNESFDRSKIFSTKTLYCVFAANVKPLVRFLNQSFLEFSMYPVISVSMNAFFFFWKMDFFWFFCNITSFSSVLFKKTN